MLALFHSCRQEWPAFHALKRTIDDFNDMCPLLELMANKAMKPRHWQRIMEVTSYNFELENESFCLKDILEAPLLKYKEDIEVGGAPLLSLQNDPSPSNTLLDKIQQNCYLKFSVERCYIFFAE